MVPPIYRPTRAEGYTVVLVNSNPATIMTDPGTADRTYVGPMTPELVEQILEKVGGWGLEWSGVATWRCTGRRRTCLSVCGRSWALHGGDADADARVDQEDAAACLCWGANSSPARPPARRLQERPDAILPTMGGQTALNLAKALSEVRRRRRCCCRRWRRWGVLPLPPPALLRCRCTVARRRCAIALHCVILWHTQPCVRLFD